MARKRQILVKDIQYIKDEDVLSVMEQKALHLPNSVQIYVEDDGTHNAFPDDRISIDAVREQLRKMGYDIDGYDFLATISVGDGDFQKTITTLMEDEEDDEDAQCDDCNYTFNDLDELIAVLQKVRKKSGGRARVCVFSSMEMGGEADTVTTENQKGFGPLVWIR